MELTLGLGLSCSRNRVARLMRARGLAGIHRRRRYGIIRLDPRRPSYSDLVKREFTPTAPDRLWVADLTQHPTGEGWLYLGVVLDAFSRRVVGWAMDSRPLTHLTVTAVKMGIRIRRPEDGLIHHPDLGAQYTATALGSTLKDAGLRGSMGKAGDALDNAKAESFFATRKTEMLDRRSCPDAIKEPNYTASW